MGFEVLSNPNHFCDYFISTEMTQPFQTEVREALFFFSLKDLNEELKQCNSSNNHLE